MFIRQATISDLSKLVELRKAQLMMKVLTQHLI